MSAFPARYLLRLELEEFLYAEAALLDAWKLDAWFALFTPDLRYIVPSTDAPDADPDTTLSIIADDADRLRARVDMLLGRHAWAENPPSRTRHLVTNVRVLDEAADGTITASANFAVHRFRHEQVEVFIGHLEYELVRDAGALRIRRKRAVLDHETLRPQGRLSILL